MKNLIRCVKLICLFLVVLFASCKKDKAVNVDIMQRYIAGKFTFQNGSQLPFALIPVSATKAIFVWVNEKREVAYTFENNRFTTSINGSEFSCDMIDGQLTNITVESTTLGIPVASLNKKVDATTALAGKQFEAPTINLNTGGVVHQNYYFKFNSDPSQLNYTSNPKPGNFIITTKTYEKLTDGCFYNGVTKVFGVVLNNKLEVEAKIGDDYVLFSGTQL